MTQSQVNVVTLRALCYDERHGERKLVYAQFVRCGELVVKLRKDRGIARYPKKTDAFRGLFERTARTEVPGIDWIEAGQIAGYGYLMAFVALGILGVIVWAVGRVLLKTTAKTRE